MHLEVVWAGTQMNILKIPIATNLFQGKLEIRVCVYNEQSKPCFQ